MPAVEREVAALIPPGLISTDHALSPVVAKADRSLKPISFALGVFGIVALVAALLIAAQLMARRFRVEIGDLHILRALGAGPPDTMLDGLIGSEASILVGSLLAAVVAIALSPVAPIGPVRAVYPSNGFSLDWVVLGLGFLILFALLSGVAVLLAYSTAPHRVARRPRLRIDLGGAGGGAHGAGRALSSRRGRCAHGPRTR